MDTPSKLHPQPTLMRLNLLKSEGTAAAMLTMLAVMVVSALIGVLYDVVSWYWLSPRRIRKVMEKQGVRGPRPKFLLGNIPEMAALVHKSTDEDMEAISHDIVGRLLPHYVAWSELYGKRFVYWNGVEPRLCLTEPELIRELLCKHASVTGKSWLQREGSKHFVGRGLLMANGGDWHWQRHAVAPAFSGQQLKSYVVEMVKCTEEMIGVLEMEMVYSKEVEIGSYLTRVTADIIARTEFGSSYEKGKKIFHLLNHLQKLCAQASRRLCIPGRRFFPNVEIHAMNAEVKRLLMEIIQTRRDRVKIGRSISHGNDLLGILLDEMEKNNSKSMNLQLIVDECKTFFFAGHETTSLLLTWTVMLLANSPLWQERVRAEVLQVCHGGPPTADLLPKLSLLTMVVNESIRLYPSATVMPRMAFEDIQLGDLLIPKGLAVWIPVLAMNHDPVLWGPDVNDFNPDRFSAKSFSSNRQFIPFAAGPRNCIGQAFAMMEVKVVLGMLISRFRFVISENYRHAPVVVLTIKPKYGVQIRLERL